MNSAILFSLLITSGTPGTLANHPTHPLKIVDDSRLPLIKQAIDTLYRPIKPDIIVPPILSLPDLSLLSKQANKTTIKYMAVGGKLSSGFRDGGLYREGQLTAFPNLIAHQMGIDEFQSPLFNPAQGNGTGYSVMTSQSPYPVWKQVENNRAISQEKPLKLIKYANGIPDNLSFPEGPSFVSSMPDNYVVVYPGQRDYMAHFNRIVLDREEGKVQLLDIIKQKAPDFCTFETHFDEFLGLAERPVNLTTSYLFSSLSEEVIDQQILFLKNQGIKLVLFTIPKILDLPYFHIFPVKGLQKNNQDVYVRYKNNHINPIKADETTLLLPTQSVYKRFSNESSQGLTEGSPFDDEDVISADEVREFQAGLTFYNDYYIRRAGKKHGIPVVDLESIYKIILSNQYTSEDGTAVTGTFPGGNYFSSDGRTPSAIGQAVIANETIKVINQHYKTAIPLISIQKFNEAIPH